MVRYASDLAFFGVPDKPNITGLNWRLMMGSAILPAVIMVFTFVFLCPESPRWYMSKGRHEKVYLSMCKLRYNKLQAARDVFYMHTLLEAENESLVLGQNKVKEMFTVPRNSERAQCKLLKSSCSCNKWVWSIRRIGGNELIWYLTSSVEWKSSHTTRPKFSSTPARLRPTQMNHFYPLEDGEF